MTIPKILVFPGSNRSGSLNVQLASVIAKELALMEVEVTRISLIDYPLPLFGEDLEREKGIPGNAMKLARLFASHQGIVIVTPEYNASLPPLLKNTIDWISRISKDNGNPLAPYRGNHFALAASSDGSLGGIRVLSHLRDILVSIGAQLVTEQLALANAGTAYDELDYLKNDRPRELLDAMCRSLVQKTIWNTRS